MRVLILYCNMGGGHFSAAEAVAEELERRGVDYTLLDALESFVSPAVSDKISDAYTGIVKEIPGLFRFMYHAGGAISSARHKSPVYRLNKAMCPKMRSCILDGGYTAVVFTHLFPAEAFTELREKGEVPGVKSIAVGTDYTCIPFWEETGCDAYILPHGDMFEEYVRRGLPGERLYAYGIPVSERFSARLSPEAARTELGFPPERPVILVMTGSMGFGQVDDLTQALTAHNGAGNTISVICGNNEKAYAQLSARYTEDAHVSVFGFEKRVPLFMDACSVLLTKPGGLTSTEAAVHGTPLVLTSPIPGCETINAEFFQAHGMALSETEPEAQALAAMLLCTDPEAAARIVRAQHETISLHAAKDICDLAMA